MPGLSMKSDATILFDGTIFALQSRGGIRRLFADWIPRVAVESSMRCVLRLPRGNYDHPPSWPSVEVLQDWDLRPWRFGSLVNEWRQERLVARSAESLLHATYYTWSSTKRIRTIQTVYDMIHEQYPALLDDPETVQQKREAFKRSDGFVAISQQTREDLIRVAGVPEDRVCVVYPAASDVFSKPVTQKGKNDFIESQQLNGPAWLHVGMRGGYKNFRVLLRAFVRIAKETNGFLLLVGGEPKLVPEEIDILIGAGCADRIRMFLGVTDEELRIMYSASTAFVSCSLAEGFGLPILEAMTCGAPLVLSDIMVYREISKEAGLLFDPRDDVALSEQLLLTLDAGVCREIARAGKKRALDFSWQQSVQNLTAFYQAML
jgi:glycosyltransferase involved in cell wall biosynthesis